VQWEDWMGGSRRPTADDYGHERKEEDVSELEWQLVEDAGGRMKAVKRPVAKEGAKKDELGDEIVAKVSPTSPLRS